MVRTLIKTFSASSRPGHEVSPCQSCPPCPRPITLDPRSRRRSGFPLHRCFPLSLPQFVSNQPTTSTCSLNPPGWSEGVPLFILCVFTMCIFFKNLCCHNKVRTKEEPSSLFTYPDTKLPGLPRQHPLIIQPVTKEQQGAM